MIVKQYDTEFDMLSGFTPEMVATEAARANKFVRGFRNLSSDGIFQLHRQKIAEIDFHFPTTKSIFHYLSGGRTSWHKGDSFKYKGTGTVVLPKVILTMKAMVREHPDVFPYELSRLLPHREVDFAIELEVGIIPISKALYRMVPAELKELMVQWLYRSFMEDFSRIASLLTQLTRKATTSVWSSACANSFLSLKQKLVTAPIFTVPDGSGSFMIYSDASKKGLGYVLMQ
ncbi:pol protein [Cucumis melo var. makuwa]|uniref:Pol protein n=1 Tax=Cucumis melo var. makuwa TaxID=1194695 RepID=A0A5A7UDG3_CUCMM|nr:pol protein [Cucumis melo var. makuwa]